MKTFKQFITEILDDPDYPKYAWFDKDPEVDAAAKKGGKFGSFRNEWLSDAEMEDVLRKVWDKKYRLYKFEDWISKTFNVKPRDIDIQGFFGLVGSYNKFTIKVSGEKWKKDDGFALRMMEKTIPAKWKQFMPEFKLSSFCFTPPFDVNDSKKTFTFHGSWQPTDYEDNRDMYNNLSITSSNGISKEEFAKNFIQHYTHNRKHAYVQWLYNQAIDKYYREKN